jgi:hypothetical protein
VGGSGAHGGGDADCGVGLLRDSINRRGIMIRRTTVKTIFLNDTENSRAIAVNVPDYTSDSSARFAVVEIKTGLVVAAFMAEEDAEKWIDQRDNALDYKICYEEQ